jgi:hypothetical protein
MPIPSSFRFVGVFFALLMAACAASGQTQIQQSAAACTRCHSAQAQTQPATPMAQALHIGATSVLKANPKLTFKNAAYSYTVETHGDKATYNVSDGSRTLSIPIRWTFGVGAQTWVLEREGKLYESLVSYYPSIQGLAITTGDERIVPATLEQAMGRELTERDSRACFGCHASDAVSRGTLHLESLQPGVTCEHCHAGSGAHLIDAVSGDLHDLPQSIRQLSPENISNFCGQCHRTWEFVVRNHWRGEVTVRFQPYRLANSKCFDGENPRLSCLTCHDPHRDLVREDSSYDKKCLACHTGSAPLAGAVSVRKSCPVAKANCVSCHMPKVNLPGGLMTFTDHQIRIVKPGDSFPN